MNGPITIIREPRVYLLGQQEMQYGQLDRFLADHNLTWSPQGDCAADELSETAGRVCYMSFTKPRPGGNKAYLANILASGHGSVLEHCVWNLLFTGISRSLSHELVRHRAGWGFSQLSQRYVDESVAEYIEPEVIATDPEMHPIWVEAMEAAQFAYQQLSGMLYAKGLARATNQGSSELTQEQKTAVRKEARQAARSVLPNATETKVFCTANARALRHFIEMRASRFADVEIRRLACKVWELLAAESPALFGDYKKVELSDGSYELTTLFEKV